MVSLFFTNANTAAAVGAVIYFLLYFAEVGAILKGFPLPAVLIMVSALS